ncbi:hypothetical protein [Orlajensenia leifsoniae]|uniref:Uncharacterized protein n=1 Tax=Orlajensenia leifsoniae TaxID=2561933 RepID=A0A4Y9R0B9_9MICO|nr:hypothetical protein [Leifsonia flava]TFV98204.1 hypothetical protein E4M00_09285 [Leifsonia flava]
MRVSTVRALAVAALTIAVVAGCAPTNQDAEPPSATIATVEPTTATTGPPPDDGGDDGVAIELAQLPIGGVPTPDPADPARQCIDVSWIAQNADGIPEGIAISVTGASFIPPIFDVVDGCAGGAPPCLGYTFDATAQNCVLAVVANGAVFDPQAPDRPRVSLAGSAECDHPDSEECSAFVAGVQADPNVAISLDFPPQGGTPDGDTTPGDTTTDDETPADDGTQTDDGTDDGNPTDVETPSDDDTGTGD